MAQRSLAQQLREVSEALEGPERYADLALALVRAKTKETILYAGGRWDRLDRRFIDETPERVAVVRLEESQVEFASWFAGWLADFREGYQRDVSLALCAGDRRGGKTFGTQACLTAAVIDVPVDVEGLPIVAWTISKSYRERDELERWMAARLPQGWFRHHRQPEHRYDFLHGPSIRMLSADDPGALKQGRCDLLLYNEPQKMAAEAVKNGLYGTADQAGITILAANPPDGPEAEWLLDLYEAIDLDQAEAGRRGKEEPLGAVYFHFASAKNTKIDQPARRRVGRIAKIIAPEGAEADEAGHWKRWGDLAYPAFSARTLDRGGLVGPVPELGATDITAEITNRIFWRPYPVIIGGDFQRKPHEAAVLLRIFDWPGGPGPIYWFFDEATIRGDEYQLSASVVGRGVAPPDGALWICDCSGSYQGSERIPGRTSFGMLEEHGWHVEPAEIIKIPEKSNHPRNPDVAARLTLMLRLMEQRRLRVDPRCEWLIEAFAKCQLRRTEYGKSIPKGRHAHITDAGCYPIWRLEPKPGDSRSLDWSGIGGLKDFSRAGTFHPKK